MAGVIPTKRGTSGRKQWTLHDGPRGSLKCLRNQLANDGCPESQVVLAKQLLEEESELEDKQENARLGVYWLIKASEQGNTEATDLLKTCLESGKGITEHNYLDVKSCITMTQDEKLARKAAREMFASLSNGGEYITSEQLQRKMLAIEKDDGDAKSDKHVEDLHNGIAESSNGELMNNFDDQSESEDDIDWSLRSDSNEKLTENNLVDAAINYAHGQLPEVNRVLCLNDPNLQALDRIPFVHRAVLHPILVIQILYYKLIRFLGRYSFSYLKSDLQILVLLTIYAFSNTTNIYEIFPVILYYITLTLMVLTTFQMLQMKREFYDFRVWSGLFISYSGGSLNANEAEFLYIRNHLSSFVQYLIALIVHLFVHPTIPKQYILQSEITLLSFCLTFMTLFGFMYKKRMKTVLDFVILLSFAINVLAKYPYETDPVVTQGWRFLELKVPTFASYVVGNGIEFCLNFQSLIYSCIPVILIKISYRDNWRGTYKYLFPHFVTLSWLHLVIIMSQGATMYGLIRSTLALVGIVLFLPLVGLTTILLPAAAVSKWLFYNNYTYTISVFMLLFVMGVSLCYILAKSRFRSYCNLLQMVIAVTATYFIVRQVVNEGQSRRFIIDAPKTISYDQYQKFCHEQAWESLSVAKTQIRCSQLQHVQVSWEGYVSDVKIKSTKNNYKFYIDNLPIAMREYLYCYYGDEVQSDCNSIDLEDCLLFYDIIRSNHVCTLDKYNVYEFEISVRMHSGLWGKGADIKLQAHSHFTNFTLQLRPEDHVWFKGVLVNDYRNEGGLGTRKPHIVLNEIGCLACQDNNLTNVKAAVETGRDYEDLLKNAAAGIKTVLNFVFFPIVVFK